MQRRPHQRRPLLLIPLTVLAMPSPFASAFQRCFARAATTTAKGGSPSRLFAAAAATTTAAPAVTDARAACELGCW